MIRDWPPDLQRWSFVGQLTLVAGALLTGAGVIELTANRHLKPGDTRDQPPWTVPVFIVGLAIILASLAILATSYYLARRHRARP